MVNKSFTYRQHLHIILYMVHCFVEYSTNQKDAHCDQTSLKAWFSLIEGKCVHR